MPAAYIQMHFKLLLTIEANTILFAIYAIKVHKQMRDQMATVVNWEEG